MVRMRRQGDRLLVSLGDYHAVVRLDDGRVRRGPLRLPLTPDTVLGAASEAGWHTYEAALREFHRDGEPARTRPPEADAGS